MVAKKATHSATVHHHHLKGEIQVDQLLKWLAVSIMITVVVIGLMKGMLALAVYLINTVPASFHYS